MAKTLQDFNFQGNPFMGVMGGAQGAQPTPEGMPAGEQSGMDPKAMMAALSQGGGMGAEGGQAQGAPAPQAGAAPVAAGEAEMMAEDDQLQKGQNPTRSRHLVKALSALEDFVSDSTDKEDVMFARGLLSALARLINKDQESLRMQVSAPTPPQTNPLQ